VTGGSRGIGRAIALRLGASGHHVAVNYSTNSSAAAEVVGMIERDGGRAVAYGADVSDSTAVEGLFQSIAADMGPVSVLVNNAGITRDTLLLRMSEADFDEVLAINLRSAFLCTRQALRHMIRSRWGRVVSIASVAGITGNAGQANYAASKAGMIGFSKAVGSRGVTVNVVAPGFISTELTQDLSETIKKEAIRRISVGRFGAADEVAAAVDFLVSDSASYVSGHVLAVDGGLAL
jgi:3-oxoacyl-[acyl-carrier protein] reductase